MYEQLKETYELLKSEHDDQVMVDSIFIGEIESTLKELGFNVKIEGVCA